MLRFYPSLKSLSCRLVYSFPFEIWHAMVAFSSFLLIYIYMLLRIMSSSSATITTYWVESFESRIQHLSYVRILLYGTLVYIYIEFGTTEYSIHGLQAHSSPPTLVSSAQVVRSNITVDKKPDLHSTTWTKLLYLFRVQDIYGSPNYYFFYFIHPHHS